MNITPAEFRQHAPWLQMLGDPVLVPLEPDTKRCRVKGWNSPQYRPSHIDPTHYGIRLDHLLVVDIDDPERYPHLTLLLQGEAKVVVSTPRGWHYYFDYHPPIGERPRFDTPTGIDVKFGPGHYVVGPGSIVNGQTYRVTKSQGPVTPLSETVAKALAQAEPGSSSLPDPVDGQTREAEPQRFDRIPPQYQQAVIRVLATLLGRHPVLSREATGGVIAGIVIATSLVKPDDAGVEEIKQQVLDFMPGDDMAPWPDYEVVPHGKRNKSLFTFGLAMRAVGYSPDMVDRLMRMFARVYCQGDYEYEADCRTTIQSVVESCASATPLDLEEAHQEFLLDTVNSIFPEGYDDEVEDDREYVPVMQYLDRAARCEWWIDGLLPKSPILLIAAQPGAGKSTIAAWLSAAVGLSDRFLGLHVAKGRVLLVLNETVPFSLLCSISEYFGLADDPAKGDDWCIYTRLPLNLVDPNHLKRFTKVLEKYRPSLVVIDTLASVLPGHDENSVQAMTPVMSFLNKTHNAFGTHFIVIHHTKKNDPGVVRGSSAIEAAVDTVIYYTAVGNGKKRRFKLGKSRLAHIMPDVHVEFAKGATGELVPVRATVPQLLKEERTETLRQVVYNHLLRSVGDFTSYASIQEATEALLPGRGLTETELRSGVRSLRRAGVLGDPRGRKGMQVLRAPSYQDVVNAFGTTARFTRDELVEKEALEPPQRGAVPYPVFELPPAASTTTATGADGNGDGPGDAHHDVEDMLGDGAEPLT